MSTQTEITRLQTARNTIRTKLVDLGLVQSSAKLDACASAIEGIENKGAVNAQVQEGATFTIPKGYHNGSGVVSGVAGGGNYSLQEKSITPTKAQQSVTPDSGYYGLSGVTVAAIPDNYNDTTPVNAEADDVLANRVIVNADGETVAGTMPNNGAVTKTLDTATTSYTIPKGYHSGSGTVKVTTETKNATPTKSVQNITPTSGKVLSKVTVAAIPAQYITTTDADAVAADILVDKTAYVNGTKVVGAMTDNGAVSHTLDASTGNQSYTIPAGKHSGTGKVQIVLEQKGVTPNKSGYLIKPTEGKVLNEVRVMPIPDEYQDVSGVTATASSVIEGFSFVDTTGALVEGAIPVNGDMNKSIDGLTITSVSIPSGYTSGGTVRLTSDIEEALAAI